MPIVPPLFKSYTSMLQPNPYFKSDTVKDINN